MMNHPLSPRGLAQAIHVGEVFPAACHDLSQMSRGHRYYPSHLTYERQSPLPNDDGILEAGNRVRLCHVKMISKQKSIFMVAAQYANDAAQYRETNTMKIIYFTTV
jgi:hypothetical protein